MEREKQLNSVVIVVPTLAREGISKQVAIQIKILQSSNVNVFIIVISSYSEEILQELDIKVPAGNIFKLNQSTSYLSIEALLKVFPILFPVLNYIKENQVQRVLAHAPYTHFIMRCVKLLGIIKGIKFKLYLYFHITQYLQFPLNTFNRKLINIINKLLAIINDDVHISVSEAVKVDIETNLIRLKNHKVIYNAIVPDIDSNSEWSDERIQSVKNWLQNKSYTFTMLLPNRIEQSKGQLFFLSVLKKFIEQTKVSSENVRLYMVGEGDDKLKVIAAIQEMALGNYVHLMGELPNKSVLTLMRAVDLVVVPSLFEGLPLVILEGLSTKSLILASDAGGGKEMVRQGETGFLFKAGSEEDCLVKLLYLYENRDKALINFQQMEQDLRNKFSVEQHSKQLLEVLEI